MTAVARAAELGPNRYVHLPLERDRAVHDQPSIPMGALPRPSPGDTRLCSGRVDLTRAVARDCRTSPRLAPTTRLGNAGRPTPARFLATTRANYGDLGGPPTSSSLDSLRRLCQHVLDKNRDLVRDPDLSAFLGGNAPRRFQAVKEFRLYDGGFS